MFSATCKLYFMLILMILVGLCGFPSSEINMKLLRILEFKVMDDNETDCKIKSIRSDNGGEFTSK